MRIQPLSGKSPYASYLSTLQKGVGENGAATAGHSLDLSLPAIKGELISRIKRYETLQAKAKDVLSSLGSTTKSAVTPSTSFETMTTQPVQLSQTSQTAAVLTSDRVTLSSSGSTDFGSLTLNGATTTLGIFSGGNAAGAAQFIADKLNANSSNAFKATVGGEQQDQVILTTQAVGSSSHLLLESAASGAAGFTTGMNARGSDGTTDLGQVSLNGITTTFGTIDNHQHTAQSVAQFMAARINQTAGTTVEAVVSGSTNDQLALTARSGGAAGRFVVTSSSNNSDNAAVNDGSNGFVAGMVSTGSETTSPNDLRAPLLLLDALATLPQPMGPAPLRIQETLKPSKIPMAISSETTEVTAASSFVQNVNHYLSALEQERKRGLPGVKSFESEFMNALQGHKSELSALGVTMVGKGLQLDPDLLADPTKFKAGIETIKQALEPVLSRQQGAMAEVSKFAGSLDAVANQISQATVNMHRLSQQSARLSSMVRFLGQRQGSLDDQADVLQRQQWTLSGSTSGNTHSSTTPASESPVPPHSPL